MSYLLAQASAHRIPLRDESIQCVVTSPPYWGLRAYSGEQEIPDWGCALGLEPTPELYVEHMIEVFREVKRVLRKDGTLWLNLGDSYAGSWGNQGRKPERGTQRPINGGMITPVLDGRYPATESNTGAVPAGLKPKDLVGVPWRVAFALQADGWYLRSDIIWAKPNPMPESVTDRPTKSHEYLFLLTKSPSYYYDAEAIREAHAREWDAANGGSLAGGDRLSQAGRNDGHRNALPEPNPAGRNARTVWTIATQPYPNVPARRVGVDGTDRKWSPSCPVHVDQRHLDATDAHGEPRAASQSGRTTHTDARPAQSPLGELAPIAQPLAEGSASGSSDSLGLEGVPLATPRSKRSRKTGPAPETSRHATADAESGNRTGGTSQSPAPVANSDRIHESNIGQDSGPDDSDSYPEARTTSRSACTCTSLVSVSHFAVFPEAIPERCIKAGSAARACAVCGAPWERVTEREAEGWHESPKDAGRRAQGLQSNVSGLHSQYRSITQTERGWQPTCAHDAGTSSSVVLDPFNGSGTTGAVALRLGRRYVGLDLSREYLSEQALARVDPLAAAAQGARNGTNEQQVLAI